MKTVELLRAERDRLQTELSSLATPQEKRIPGKPHSEVASREHIAKAAELAACKEELGRVRRAASPDVPVGRCAGEIQSDIDGLLATRDQNLAQLKALTAERELAVALAEVEELSPVKRKALELSLKGIPSAEKFGKLGA